MLNLEYIYREIKKKNVTLMLLWEEYKTEHPDGLMLTAFSDRYRTFKNSNNMYMHKDHKAGESMEVDWAGSTMPYFDRVDTTEKEAHIFVSVLPASSYPFCKAYPDETLPNWIKAHTDAYEYIGGVPEVTIPDNAKTAVTKPSSTDPVFNRSYRDMAMHYGTNILPARPRKPRDKGADEGMVRIVGQRILAPLRNKKFFSIAEINAAISEQMEKLIERSFQKIDTNRKRAFEEIDKPALKPLPANKYEYAIWKESRVRPDYHVEYEGFFYSVFHEYINNACTIRATDKTIEVFVHGERIAVYERNRNTKDRYTTTPEHMPQNHRLVSGLGRDHFISKAEEIGPITKELIKKVLETSDIPVQSYRVCSGMLGLVDGSVSEVVEKTSAEALEKKLYTLKYFKMLFGKYCQHKSPAYEEKIITHKNIRGKKSFAGGTRDA